MEKKFKVGDRVIAQKFYNPLVGFMEEMIELVGKEARIEGIDVDDDTAFVSGYWWPFDSLIPAENKNDISQMSFIDLSIYVTMLHIEKMGANENLTKAVVLLSEVKTLVRDYVNRHL